MGLWDGIRAALDDISSVSEQYVKPYIRDYTPVGWSTKYADWAASKLPRPEDTSSPLIAGLSGGVKEAVHQAGEQVTDPLNIALMAAPESRVARLAAMAVGAPQVVRGSQELGAGIGEGNWEKAGQGLAQIGPGVAGVALPALHLGRARVPEVASPSVERIKVHAAAPIEGNGPKGTLEAADILSHSKEWGEYSDWIKRVHDKTKQAILGLPEDVLPPSEPLGTHRGVQGKEGTVADTEYAGADLTPGTYGHNTMLGFRNADNTKITYASEGIRTNPLLHIRDMAEDAQKYPVYADIMADPVRRNEDFLRRDIVLHAHELSHSTGAMHPAKDIMPNEIFDSEKGDWKSEFYNDPNAKIAFGHSGDIRFRKILKATLRNYEDGAYHELINEAHPNADRWWETFKRANEAYEGRRPTASGAVPPEVPKEPGPTPVRVGGSGTEGIPPGGLPGGTGAPAGPEGGGAVPPSGTGGEGGGPPGVEKPPKTDWSKLPQHDVPTWIRLRKAAPIHGQAARYNFKDLLGQGMDWIKKFEEQGAGSVPGGDRVKTLFDSLAAEEKRYGVPIKERPNYIYHIWEEDPDVVRQAFRRLGIRPSFTHERIYDTYEAGIKAGLTPKYTNPADIIAERVRQSKKLIADKGLYNTMRAHKLMKPEGKQPRDWHEIRNFPFMRFTQGKYQHVKAWYTMPEVAERLNRYLDSPATRPFPDFTQKLKQIGMDIKNVVLSSGIPGTSFNAHGFNTAFRDAGVKSTGDFITGLVKTPFDLLSTGKEDIHWLNEHLNEMARATEAGASFSLEDHPVKTPEDFTPPTNLFKKPFWSKFGKEMEIARTAGKKHFLGEHYAMLRKAHELLFEDPLFQRRLVAKKLQYILAEEERLKKTGVAPDVAIKTAAKNGNTFYGGNEWEGKTGFQGDPHFRAWTQILLVAPDWAETNLHIAKGTLDWMKNPSDPRFKSFKNLAQNTALFYLAANAINAVTGTRKEFGAERHFQIGAGKTTTGRTRFIRPVGTGADYARVPYEIITKLAQGDLSGASDTVRNRMHPMIQGIVNVVLNRNYWNRPLTGKELPLLTQAGRLAHEVTAVAGPQYLSAPVAAAAGEAGPEETLAKSVEAPLAYARPLSSLGTGGRSVFRRGRPGRAAR